MTRSPLLPVMAVTLAAAAPLACSANVVFSDNFSSSTMNAAAPAAPTATSTDYAILSAKDATGSSIGANDLKLVMPSTTSGFVEAQTRFTTTPVTLASTGDYIQLSATFTATAGILAGPGTGSYLSFGLFNTGGVGPVAGGVLTKTGLNGTAGSPYASGNAANWQGYMAKIRETTGGSGILTRPIQNGTGTASRNQDLIFSGESSGYNNPLGTQIGTSGTFGTTLAQGNQYTYTLTLMLDASTGFLTATENLYAGVGTGGTSLYSLSGTSTAASTPTLQFDGLALGYRFAEGTGAPSTLDVNQIAVESFIQDVPEPGSLALLAVGAAGLLLARRRTA